MAAVAFRLSVRRLKASTRYLISSFDLISTRSSRSPTAGVGHGHQTAQAAADAQGDPQSEGDRDGQGGQGQADHQIAGLGILFGGVLGGLVHVGLVEVHNLLKKLSHLISDAARFGRRHRDRFGGTSCSNELGHPAFQGGHARRQRLQPAPVRLAR
jgi:hypothetical protein